MSNPKDTQGTEECSGIQIGDKGKEIVSTPQQITKSITAYQFPPRMGTVSR